MYRMFRNLAQLIAVLGISFGQASAMNGETEKKFHDAVRIGDINTVRSMISADPALATSTDEYQFQPIHLLDMYFEEEILDHFRPPSCQWSRYQRQKRRRRHPFAHHH